MELALVVLVVAFALGFDYTNGFHDAANAIATSVSTRALTPARRAAHGGRHQPRRRPAGHRGRGDHRDGIVNLAGAGTARRGLVVVLSGLIGAIVWNLITWWLGLPSSSTHALIGGLIGAGLARRHHRALGRDRGQGRPAR